MAISLVLPCYNPSEGWERNVQTAFNAFCKAIGKQVQLIIVLDGEGREIKDAALLFLKTQIPLLHIVKYAENRGKGYAIRQGVAEAAGDVILYTDIDFPYTTDSMTSVYHSLANGECDVAVGVKNAGYYSKVPPLRRTISRFLRFLIRVFLSMPVTDTQCGLKGFRKEVAPLFLKTTINRYLFDLEFIRNCFKEKKYKVKAIPVALNENVQFRSMDYRILLPELLNFVKLLFK